MKQNYSRKNRTALIDLGAASTQTKALTSGADDSKAGLWFMPGLSVD